MNETRRTQTDETRIAEEIVKALPEGTVARVCSDDRKSIRYAVRSRELKLRTIVLSRASLRKLAADPACEVKLEYLRRDLAESASRRAEFRYPRPDFAARRVAITRSLAAVAAAVAR